MAINGIYMNALAGYETKKQRNMQVPNVGFSEIWRQDKTGQPEEEKYLKRKEDNQQELSKQREDTAKEDGQTETQIIVKPDGSRVLLVNVKAVGMEITTSLKISDATDMQNDSHTEMESFSECNFELAEALEKGKGNCSL